MQRERAPGTRARWAHTRAARTSAHGEGEA